jgi:hypothetical protein
VSPLLACLLNGCANRASNAGQTSGPQPVAPDIQRVCANFVTTALQVDTTTDTGPVDARRRAARLFGVPELAGQLAGQGNDTAWATLREHRASVKVTTRPITDDPPTPGDGQAAAGVEVSRTALGRDAWQQPLPPAVAYCALRHDGTGWKVTSFTLAADEGQEPR